MYVCLGTVLPLNFSRKSARCAALDPLPAKTGGAKLSRFAFISVFLFCFLFFLRNNKLLNYTLMCSQMANEWSLSRGPTPIKLMALRHCDLIANLNL